MVSRLHHRLRPFTLAVSHHRCRLGPFALAVSHHRCQLGPPRSRSQSFRQLRLFALISHSQSSPLMSRTLSSPPPLSSSFMRARLTKLKTLSHHPCHSLSHPTSDLPIVQGLLRSLLHTTIFTYLFLSYPPTFFYQHVVRLALTRKAALSQWLKILLSRTG